MSPMPTRYHNSLLLLAFVLVLGLCLGLVQDSRAATTGKISGIITDIKTGEPIISVNVLIEGTYLGAATNLDGDYAIINVPPGLYKVTFTCVGYHDFAITDVYVASDQTTTLNVELTPDRYKLEEVEVVYDKPQVILGETVTMNRIDKEVLNSVRPQDVADVVKISKGFKIDEEGKMHARGGRSGDVALIVEGVDLRDPLVDTQFQFQMSSESVDEINVLTGGFSAEYGRAMGALIQVTTTEGKPDKYVGRVEYQTDRLIETYSFDTDRLQLAFGGPIPFTKQLLKRPITFYFTGIGVMTNTYTPFDIDRPNNDYLGVGLDLPERQKNDYQTSLKLAYNLTEKQKLTLYLTEAYHQWDIYPTGEGGVSGNYGYGYKYNLDKRPWAWNKQFSANLSYNHQISPETFYEFKLIAFRTHSKVQPRGKSPSEFTMLDDIENDQAQAFDRNFNGYLDADEYLDSDGDGFMDGFWDANGNGIFDGGGEGYEDLNMNGRWDRGEDWVDLNSNGIYDAAEPWIDVVNPLTGENNIGVFDPWDTYTDINENGRWDPSEPQLPEQDWNGNGQWDGERFIDANNNGGYDAWETWDDLNNNFLWDEGEPFVDKNGNGQFDYSEGYDDMNRSGDVDRRDLSQRDNSGSSLDAAEPFIDGDYWWDTGEPFIDEPDPITGEYNGYWDAGEIWFDLPSSSDLQTGAGLWHIGDEMTLNGRYDPPNALFDEYELFTRPANWNYNADPSRPVTYTFDPDARGTDWPADLYTFIPGKSTWVNRTLDDTDAPVFDMRNYSVEEDSEWYLDYNNNGEWNASDGFLNPDTWDPTAYWYDRLSTEYTAKFDIQSQVSKFHEVKTGFELRYRDLSMQAIMQPDLPYTGEAALPEGSYAPDRGGVRDFYEYKPWEGAFYAQDKMEFEGLIVNAGIRFDFILHDQKIVDEFRERVANDEPGAIYASRGTWRVSPRLGISHPITNKSKLYFNYGHFYQAPNFQYFYKSATANFEANTVIGNPNLEYEKTIQYELGVNNQISEYVVLDLAGYYRDQYDMISTQDEKWKNIALDRYANIDYGRMRGFEISVEKRPANHYAFTANYDFSYAYGKASSQLEAQEARLSNVPYNYDEHPLDWDETHKLNCYFTVVYGRGEYPKFFGLVLPDDWQLTIQWQFGSGLPYTPSKYLTGIEDSNLILANSARRPWHETTTLKFEKYFTVNAGNLKKNQAGNQLIVGVNVGNLFNKRNIYGIYSETGSPTESVHPMNPAYNPNNNRADYDANPRNFGSPRNVMFRIGLSF